MANDIKIDSSYFLTAKQKKQTLLDLKDEIKAGLVDKEMIAFLKKINNIPGVVSLFCCSGHGGYCHGNLLVHISKDVFKKLFLKGSSTPLWAYLPGELNISAELDFFDNKCRLTFSWIRFSQLKDNLKNITDAIMAALHYKLKLESK